MSLRPPRTWPLRPATGRNLRQEARPVARQRRQVQRLPFHTGTGHSQVQGHLMTRGGNTYRPSVSTLCWPLGCPAWLRLVNWFRKRKQCPHARRLRRRCFPSWRRSLRPPRPCCWGRPAVPATGRLRVDTEHPTFRYGWLHLPSWSAAMRARPADGPAPSEPALGMGLLPAVDHLPLPPLLGVRVSSSRGELS